MKDLEKTHIEETEIKLQQIKVINEALKMMHQIKARIGDKITLEYMGIEIKIFRDR